MATASREIAARLKGKTGRSLWRSLDELAETEAFRSFLEAEFPALASRPDGVSRRSMLKVMWASLALAGLTGCEGEPDEAALPYVEAPESVVPGVPDWYATAVTLSGFALPAIGKTHTGRPIKLEGNPDHPAWRGATDPFLQGALLGLYDPDRSQSPRHLGRPAGWSAFDTAMVAQAAELDRSGGTGFRLLTGSVTSPTLARQIRGLVQRWPKARWHVSEPVNDDLALAAAERVFGRPLDRHLMLDQAETTVAFDDDFLGPGPRQAIHARRWSDRRLQFQRNEGKSRLFVAEATPSLTGAVAEKRLVAAPSRIDPLLRALAAALGVTGVTAPQLSESEREWVARALAALQAAAPRALVAVGAHQPEETQALGLLVNARMGAIGRTLRFTDPVALVPPDGARSLEVLAEAMRAGQVTTLAVIGANPAYAAAAEIGFQDAMQAVPLRLHAGFHYDETASHSHWHLPLAHELESWSDARSADGTATIIQPLVRPFYAVRSQHVVLDNLAGMLGTSDRDIVRRTWRANWNDGFDAKWRSALVRGFIPDSAPPFIEPSVGASPVAPSARPAERGLTILLRADSTIWDGRFADNAWLQETPKPLTKVTWGNVILVSPALARERGMRTGDQVRLAVAGRDLRGPIWVMPGQARDTVTVTLGYGRRRSGRNARQLGYDAFAIQQRASPWLLAGAELEPTGERELIASTQLHQAMHGHDFVRTVGVDALTEGAQRADKEARPPTFYPSRQWDSPSWGMTIDTDLCIGCNACVVACVAENNVAMVGKERVAEGREMLWLRVDHYHEGDPADPKHYFQPVPCMHCEQAPCEMGCPVNASVHSSDGLNLQVYNRCIGTRTCSSFCPYKVRRFNWFDYTSDDPESLRAMRNPDVTVRARGVMEKCTYCIQRISRARIAAKIDGRPIRDGEVKTACQQACPTRAIVFGDVVDPDTAVSRQKRSARNYSLLEEANTWPRTTYLARIETGEDEPG